MAWIAKRNRGRTRKPFICGDLVPFIHGGKHAAAFDTVHMKLP